MYRFAIIEDDKEDANRLKQYINEYKEEKNLNIDIKVFNSSLIFLNEDSSKFDAIFLDILLVGLDGLELATKIREKDKKI